MYFFMENKYLLQYCCNNQIDRLTIHLFQKSESLSCVFLSDNNISSTLYLNYEGRLKSNASDALKKKEVGETGIVRCVSL